ncbi:MAG: hypothetical protein JNK67_28215 [Alphaproteobacteria bacterium]|nr:hypothetical protein [Alphaproteobacteria bacterium]
MRAATIALLAGASLAALDATAQVRCPAELAVNEQPQAPPGFRGDGATRTRPFLRMSVFDGLPAEKADLAPSRESREGEARVQIFDLPDPRTRPAVLVCRYLDTDATLTVALPTTIKRCSFRFVWNAAAKRIETGRTKPQASCG